MNLSFNGNELYKGFNLVTSIVPSSAIKHILQGIRFEVGDKKVELTATDLEVLVKYTLLARESARMVALFCRQFVLIIYLENGQAMKKCWYLLMGSCVLKSGKGYFKIAGEDSSQFPMITITDVKSFVEVDGGIIGDIVGKVIHVASTMRARSTLCGVFVKIDKEEIVMAAADGNRLSMVKRKVENPDGGFNEWDSYREVFNVSATFFIGERGNAEGWNRGVSDTLSGGKG